MAGKQRAKSAPAACTHERRDGRPCGATPMRGKALCFWHDPSTADEAAEARRLGGLRRRREKTVAAAYEFDGLGSPQAIRRVLEIAAVDALGLDNSVARLRVLIAVSATAVKLIEFLQFGGRWIDGEE